MTMTAGAHGVVLTYDDLRQMPEDGRRYEIMEGVLQVSPSPGTAHQRATTRLAWFLHGHTSERGLGEVFVAPCDVVLSQTSVVEPDLLFVAVGGRAIIRPAYVEGPPDLVVEVLSPSTAARDLGAKRQLYATFGVPFYWIVDPITRTIAAHALQDGEYREIARAQGDATFSAPPFLDLAIPLSALWGS
jgi:Uma2 family endonuclease